MTEAPKRIDAATMRTWSVKPEARRQSVHPYVRADIADEHKRQRDMLLESGEKWLSLRHT